jgi:hypothetical protein
LAIGPAQGLRSVARRLVLAGSCALFTLAASATHGTAQELRLLVSLLRESLAPALLLAACGFRGLLLALRHRRTVLALAIVAAILMAVLIAIPIAEAALVPSEGPVMSAAALVAVAGLVACLLTRWRLGLLMRQRRLKAVVEPLFPLVVTEFVAYIARLAHALAVAVGHVARLLQLLAIGHDDARVMLGVLQIVLC